MAEAVWKANRWTVTVVPDEATPKMKNDVGLLFFARDDLRDVQGVVLDAPVGIEDIGNRQAH